MVVAGCTMGPATLLVLALLAAVRRDVGWGGPSAPPLPDRIGEVLSIVRETKVALDDAISIMRNA